MSDDEEESDASTSLVIHSRENETGGRDGRTLETATRRSRRSRIAFLVLSISTAIVIAVTAVGATVLGLELRAESKTKTDYDARARALLAEYPVIDGLVLLAVYGQYSTASSPAPPITGTTTWPTS